MTRGEDHSINPNLDTLKAIPEDQLSRTLLDGLSSGHMPGIFIDGRDDRYLTDILGDLYGDLEPELQEKMRQAVADGISQWNPGQYPVDTLREMGLLAADTRAEEAIPALTERVEEFIGADLEQFGDVTSSFVAVLHGFMSNLDAEETFARWYQDPAYRMYYGHLCLGLCEARPNIYPEYINRFVEMEEEQRSPVSYPLFFGEFGRVVDAQIFIREHERLNDQAQRFIEQYGQN